MGGEPLSRLPRKRELAALAVLHRRGPRLNYGEAIEILSIELCVTRKTARNIVKRLRRIGSARIEVSGGSLTVEVESPDSLIYRVVETYLTGRKRRCSIQAYRRGG